MDKKTYNDIQKSIKELNTILQDSTLTEEEKEKLTNSKISLQWILMQDWLPRWIWRRLLMLIICIIWLYWILNISLNFVFLFLILIFLSPRAIGEIIIFLKK